MSIYSLSYDYSKLYRLLDKGEPVAAFVDYSFNGGFNKRVMRDICQVVKKDEFGIKFFVRGMTYDEVSNFDCADRDEKTLFILCCKKMNLGWIKP
jgi:hypothetical protein